MVLMWICRWCPDFGSGSAGRRGKQQWSVMSWVASHRRRRRFWTLFWTAAWTCSSPSYPSKIPNRSPIVPHHHQGADTQHRTGRRRSTRLLQLRTLLLLLRVEASKHRLIEREWIKRQVIYWDSILWSEFKWVKNARLYRTERLKVISWQPRNWWMSLLKPEQLLGTSNITWYEWKMFIK